MDLDGDVALVTASLSGLGKASARSLASVGADVVIAEFVVELADDDYAFPHREPE